MMVHAWNPGRCAQEAQEFKVILKHSKFEACLGYMRLS